MVKSRNQSRVMKRVKSRHQSKMMKTGFERSRLGGYYLLQKVPGSPVTRNIFNLFLVTGELGTFCHNENGKESPLIKDREMVKSHHQSQMMKMGKTRHQSRVMKMLKSRHQSRMMKTVKSRHQSRVLKMVKSCHQTMVMIMVKSRHQ